MAEKRTGLVISSTGSNYVLIDRENGTSVDAGMRGRLRLKGVRSTNPVAVGDIVDFETDESGESVITEIHQRQNYIIRRASNLSKESHIIAANIDQAALVVTLAEPETKAEFIDRFLVTCEAYRIPATIILNKRDILDGMPEAVAEFRHIYEPAGYPVMEVSATEGRNIDMFAAFLQGKTTLLSGNSGVGKSSLIKLVEPDADIRIGDISKSHNKGRHTTTFARMYPLSQGGYIIDTPGIKGFGLIDIESEELWHFFPEMMKYAPGCQFYNCTHIHEPGCAVLQAVADDNISESRYVSYLKILEEDEKHRK